jgi:hypothetical protein
MVSIWQPHIGSQFDGHQRRRGYGECGAVLVLSLYCIAIGLDLEGGLQCDFRATKLERNADGQRNCGPCAAGR